MRLNWFVFFNSQNVKGYNGADMRKGMCAGAEIVT